MEIKKESFSGTQLVPLETELLGWRCVFVEGEISQPLADEFVKELAYLCLSEGEGKVRVYVNSPGGDVDAGLKMCEALRSFPGDAEIYCFGRAYSMAAVLFESCSGARHVVGKSKLMFHQPSVLGQERLRAKELEELSQRTSEVGQELLCMVSERTGVPVSELEEMVRGGDAYFSGKEAVEKMLADDIVSFSEAFSL